MTNLALSKHARFQELDDTVKDCVMNIESDTWALAKALAEIKKEELWKWNGFSSWSSYCEKRLPIGYTYANMLIAGWEKINYFQTTPVVVSQLPRSERVIRPLTKLSNQEALETWQEVARENKNPTAKDVEEAVKQKKRQNSHPRPEPPMAHREFITVQEWQVLTDEEREHLITATNINTKFNRQKNDNIEWAQWSWNPIVGCLHGCDYCYARDIANRYYETGFTPVFIPGRLQAPLNTPYPQDAAYDIGMRNVFTVSMGDLFGKWVPEDWITNVITAIDNAPHWNFLVLTKYPRRLLEFDFPPNMWVGTTVDTQARVKPAEEVFAQVKAAVKFVSCEPFSERLTFSRLSVFHWVILGGASKSTLTPQFKPPREWINHLEQQARDAGCMIYEKPNLLSRICEYPQEDDP